jgi:hypothetical protein
MMILSTDADYKSTDKTDLMRDMVTISGRFNLTNTTQEVPSGLCELK